LTYADFLSYNSSTRTDEISESGILKVKNLSHSTHGIAFAIKADRELVYSGYFWPGYSSMSCDWVTIDPMSIAYSGTCAVRLGYPGATNGVIIPDKRNDPRILDIFRRDNKLIE